MRPVKWTVHHRPVATISKEAHPRVPWTKQAAEAERRQDSQNPGPSRAVPVQSLVAFTYGWKTWETPHLASPPLASRPVPAPPATAQEAAGAAASATAASAAGVQERPAPRTARPRGQAGKHFKLRERESRDGRSRQCVQPEGLVRRGSREDAAPTTPFMDGKSGMGCVRGGAPHRTTPAAEVQNRSACWMTRFKPN